MNTTEARSLHPLVIALVPILFLAACATSVLQQGWWSNNGPVIPHDNFPADCSLCHVGDAWNEVKRDFVFDHEKETGVALAGAHQEAQCLRCHNDRGPVAAFAARGCAGCHEDVHLGKLGENCSDCHSEMNWMPQGQITEHARYGFALVGAHAATACFRCHEGFEAGIFTPTDASCEACHQAPSGATGGGIDHIAQGWVMDCQRCHIATSFRQTGFGHQNFPLTGVHASLDCTSCHVGGSFSALATDCFSCHADAYNATTNPDHLALGISTMCQDCHSTATWKGARFNHVGITTGCVDCHQDNYNATTNPDHLAVGFPTSCENCHTTNRWQGATFNHSFPIASGKHSGFNCVDCHTTGSFPDFSCFKCHGQNETNNKHDGVNGYTYTSPACLSCHPTGRAD